MRLVKTLLAPGVCWVARADKLTAHTAMLAVSGRVKTVLALGMSCVARIHELAARTMLVSRRVKAGIKGSRYHKEQSP